MKRILILSICAMTYSSSAVCMEIDADVPMNSIIGNDQDAVLANFLTAIKNNKPENINEILKRHPYVSKNCFLVKHRYVIEEFDDEVSALHIAAAYDHPKCMNVLLAYGAESNEATDKGNTPLHFVKSSKGLNVLRAYGGKVDQQNNEGNTPLWSSLFDTLDECGGEKYYDRMEIARALLAAGAYVTIRNKKQEHILTKAARNNAPRILDLILSHGVVDCNATKETFEWVVKEHELWGRCKKMLNIFEKYGLLFFPEINPALFFTIPFTQGNLTAQEFLYLNYCARLFAAAHRLRRCDIFDTARDGLIASRYGCIARYVEPADLKILFSEQKYKTLHESFMVSCHKTLECIHLRNIEQLKARLDKTPFVLAYDSTGTQKILHAALGDTDPTILTILLEHGIDCKGLVQDWSRDTCNYGGNFLHYAVGRDRPEAIKLLADYGVDCLHADGNGLTPLQFAVQLKRIACAEILNKILQEQCWRAFDRGDYRKAKKILLAMSDINTQNEEGNTLAHILPCFTKKPQLKKFIGLLCRRRADFNIHNKNNDTPLWHLLNVAVAKVHIFEPLLNAGANVNNRSNSRDSLLGMILLRKEFDVAELFLQHEAIVDKEDLQEHMPQALKEKMQSLYNQQQDPQQALKTCSICCEYSADTCTIPCKNKHTESMCKGCLAMSKICPYCRGELDFGV